MTAPHMSSVSAAPPTVPPLLQVRDLNAYYGQSHVLHGINLHVQPGEIVSLIGRNGAGKTTTLRSIMGALRTRTGSVTFDGQDILRLPSNRVAARGLAWVPEERAIMSTLTVRENLELPRPVPAAGRRSAPTRLSRCCASAATTPAANSPAASSRC